MRENLFFKELKETEYPDRETKKRRRKRILAVILILLAVYLPLHVYTRYIKTKNIFDQMYYSCDSLWYTVFSLNGGLGGMDELERLNFESWEPEEREQYIAYDYKEEAEGDYDESLGIRVNLGEQHVLFGADYYIAEGEWLSIYYYYYPDEKILECRVSVLTDYLKKDGKLEFDDKETIKKFLEYHGITEEQFEEYKSYALERIVSDWFDATEIFTRYTRDDWGEFETSGFDIDYYD